MKHLSAAVIVLLVTLLWNGIALCEDSNEELVAVIKSKWQERYGKIKSVEFTLDIKDTIEKGFFTSIPFPPRPGGPPPGVVLPEEDVVNRGMKKFIIDGQKIFMESRGPVYRMGIGWVEVYERSAFNGQETRVVQETNDDSKKRQGSLRPVRKLGHDDVIDFYPLACFLGPLWVQQIEPGEIKSAVDIEPNTDAILEVLDKRSGLKLWLDTVFDYMPVGIGANQEKSGWNIEIAYDVNEIVGWYPLRWKLTNRPLTVQRTTEYELTNLKFNMDIAPTQFEIEFPSGIRVIDSTQKQPGVFEIKPDGSRVPIPGRKRRLSSGGLN